MTKKSCEQCYHKDICYGKAIFGDNDICDLFKDKDTIVELPCKVGDTVYSNIYEAYGTIKFRVENVFISSENVVLFNAYSGFSSEFGYSGLNLALSFSPKNVGKTVFLHREEAEKALKELKNGKQ